MLNDAYTLMKLRFHGQGELIVLCTNTSAFLFDKMENKFVISKSVILKS